MTATRKNQLTIDALLCALLAVCLLCMTGCEADASAANATQARARAAVLTAELDVLGTLPQTTSDAEPAVSAPAGAGTPPAFDVLAQADCADGSCYAPSNTRPKAAKQVVRQSATHRAHVAPVRNVARGVASLPRRIFAERPVRRLLFGRCRGRGC